MSIQSPTQELILLPQYDLPERLLPISGSLEIVIPIADKQAIPIEAIYDIEVRMVVNGELKAKFRREASQADSTNAWHFDTQKPGRVYCFVSSQETTAWRGLVQAYIKLISIEKYSISYVETQYLPINLFIARKGFEAITLPPTPRELMQ